MNSDLGVMWFITVYHHQPDDIVFGMLFLVGFECVFAARTDGNAVERPDVTCIAALSRRESNAFVFLHGNGVVGEFAAVSVRNADSAVAVCPVVSNSVSVIYGDGHGALHRVVACGVCRGESHAVRLLHSLAD